MQVGKYFAKLILIYNKFKIRHMVFLLIIYCFRKQHFLDSQHKLVAILYAA